jgi:SAM-dependent methyltransferase
MFRHTAHIYDLIYEATGKDYAAESSAIRRLIQARKPGALTLLDVACGTGGHLRHLQHHYGVTGVDLDPNMLREARNNVPGIPLVEGDMRTLRLGTRFDAVICLFSSIGCMRNTEELTSAITAMANHLNPDGVLIVDGWVRPDAWRDGGSTSVEVAISDEIKIARVVHSLRHRSATHLEMHHLVATQDGIEHLVDHHELTLFAPDEYDAAFRSVGLVSEMVGSPMEGRDRYIAVTPHTYGT